MLNPQQGAQGRSPHSCWTSHQTTGDFCKSDSEINMITIEYC